MTNFVYLLSFLGSLFHLYLNLFPYKHKLTKISDETHSVRERKHSVREVGAVKVFLGNNEVVLSC